MMKRRYIHFILTGEQWLGLLVVVMLVVGTLSALKCFQPAKEPIEWVNDSARVAFDAYRAEQDSLRRAAWKRQYQPDTIEIILQRFDPNLADSSTLVHLGLKPWQVKNMLKYRAAGGVYRKAEDLKKLYGMTDSMYQVLAPYVYITRNSMEKDSLAADTKKLDSIPLYKNQKKDTVLNLRTADTTELKMIRGIGSYRARKIVEYRERLGGFARVEQLLEAGGMDSLRVDSLLADSVLNSFYLDTIQVDQIDVNTVSVRGLMRLPYLRFEQAQAIYELRRRKIRLDSIEQLQSIECLSYETLQNIAPYLKFNKK